MTLRKRAEAAWQGLRGDISALSSGKVRRLVHELEVHQIELEMQNEELLRAQMELAESLDRSNELYDFAPVSYVTLDGEGRILQANLRAAMILGVERAKLLGQRFSRFVVPDDQDAFYLHRQAVFSGASKRSCELELLTANGTRIAVQLESNTVEEREAADAWRCTISDISELKKLADELKLRMEQLAEADRRKDEYLAMLAHELRNPLAPLRNHVALLQRRAGSDPAVQESVAVMDRQVVHITRLVDDLLDLSRVTRGQLQLRKAKVDFASIVNAAVESSRPLIDRKEQRLTVMLPESPINLDGDLVRLTQVFHNLLSNAAKYTRPAGQIVVTVERTGAWLVARVRDDGIGIDAEKLPLIFDLFYQVDTAHEHVEGGLGLGLTLVRKLLELHGGRIEVHSAGVGQGSEFFVTLPVLD